MKRPALHMAGIGLALLCLSACAAATDDAATATSKVYPYVKLSPTPPPPPQMEIKPPPAQPMREIWRPGYWSYNGHEFKWVHGSYVMRPAPNAAWMPDRWEHRMFGWAFISGYWQ